MDRGFEMNHYIYNIWIISTRILISPCHNPKVINSWKTSSGQKAEGKKVTINMWMLLNKQVLKRQSTACAQNGAATIKCLGQDVHQSVVFQKIPNKSSLSINGRTSQRRSYSAIHVFGEEDRYFITQGQPVKTHVAGWLQLELFFLVPG